MCEKGKRPYTLQYIYLVEAIPVMKLHVAISQPMCSFAKVILSLQQNDEEIGAANDNIAPFSISK